MKTKETYRCDKWITRDVSHPHPMPDAPHSERCRCPLGHKGLCVGDTISGTGYVPGDEPHSCPPLSQVRMTAPGIWVVEIWSTAGRCYLPAGEVVENYRPYDQWKDSPNPLRDGFRYKLLTENWKEARVIYSFLEARDWIINHNPFGIVAF